MEKILIDAFKVKQPIGTFFCGVIDAAKLKEITYSDIRRLEKSEGRELDDFIGIQRPLSETRRKSIEKYIKGPEATFPNSVIISINENNVDWDEEEKKLIIKYESESKKRKIAKILDGQHRVSGFNEENLTFFDDNDQETNFGLLVTIFVEADLSTQANIFATVNLAQTKVNRSLVYDLESLARSRSPEKTCHDIAVLLNKEKGPFYRRIKRLGVATKGVKNELLTQASFVQNILKLMTHDATADRNYYLGKEKGGEKSRLYKLEKTSYDDAYKYPFRASFLNSKDSVIASNINNFFSAVEKLWPNAWSKENKNSSLNKTIGFIALARILKRIMQQFFTVDGIDDSKIYDEEEFLEILDGGVLDEADFENLDATSKSTRMIYNMILENLLLDEDEE
ncbi:DGQHR domain-containing protein [Pseudoalteromonas sp. S4498]|uniref:DGQHR domain-containing protein n=1 Tax=Pseudoalteromonas galatheae TaxID=579562 RepID=UPI0011092D6D|nr:DGQHR domain-containing protein [Pseudoalteromonas galatheae]NKC21475.1 DGQHR domain-containing protein [Pseudoalteromonas galatheae]